MDKLFQIRFSEEGLGRYNATRTSTVYVVADDSNSAIRSVLTERTIHVEIVSSHPCLIVK